MTMRVYLLLASIFASLATLTASAQAAGHVYLLKGGFGGVFSTGMDELAQKLSQRGYTATVHSYEAYEQLATEAAREQESGHGPIIIIGHSFGANDAVLMADRMRAAGARVALVVTFGPTQDLIAPPNVAHIVNYYQGGALVRQGPGFKGTISNVNLDGAADINHFNIEKINNLHANVIARIQMVAGRAHIGKAAHRNNARQRGSDRVSSYRDPQMANW
jgi:pimeloyl-ACP methyl ester carboxylesterase